MSKIIFKIGSKSRYPELDESLNQVCENIENMLPQSYKQHNRVDFRFGIAQHIMPLEGEDLDEEYPAIMFSFKRDGMAKYRVIYERAKIEQLIQLFSVKIATQILFGCIMGPSVTRGLFKKPLNVNYSELSPCLGFGLVSDSIELEIQRTATSSEDRY